MTKLNMLFDASVLIYSFKKESSRSGVFWVAYNLLKQFDGGSKFDITLFLPFARKKHLSKFKHDDYFNKFKFIILDEEIIYKENIKKYKQNMVQAKNLFIVFIMALKLIKNYIKMFLFLLFEKSKNTIAWESIDVCFSPVNGIAEPIRNLRHIQRFGVLHDTIPIKYNPKSSWWKDNAANLDKQTWCFCVSRCTLLDYLAVIPERLDEQKMSVVHIAAAQQFTPHYDKSALKSTLRKYGINHNPEDNYIFSLCSIDPRKNLIFTVVCFIKFIQKHKIKNLYFYLGGGHYDSFVSEFNQKFIELTDNGRGGGLTDKIIRLGYIDDEDVNILLSNSLFFTYISQYEGFGIPPLEAMQAGTPVITSNNSSLPEVVGDAAVMIDCGSEEQCIKAFEDLYFNEELRKYYIEKGLEQAKLFSWEKTADKMTGIITDVVERKNKQA